MSDFKKITHAIWQRKYHIVWRPTYRFSILRGALQISVKEIVNQLCEWKKVEILEMNLHEEHMRLVISVPPKYAVTEIIEFLKGKCAIKIFGRHLELKKGIGGDIFARKDTV